MEGENIIRGEGINEILLVDVTAAGDLIRGYVIIATSRGILGGVQSDVFER